ncbi:hypothetical protein ACE6H2_006791 [Prunus campanulata]
MAKKTFPQHWQEETNGCQTSNYNLADYFGFIMAATDDGLKKLEYLSLVSKVCSELETHIGVGDKVLAEFITELG